MNPMVELLYLPDPCVPISGNRLIAFSDGSSSGPRNKTLVLSQLVSVSTVKDPLTGVSQRVGVLTFGEDEAASEAAVLMDGLDVTEDWQPPPRPRSSSSDSGSLKRRLNI